MLIKLTFFTWVKKFSTRALCTKAQNFVSYRTLIHSTICIIYGKPGSVKKKEPLRRKCVPIFCLSFPLNIQWKSWVFCILWNLVLGIVPYFFYDGRVVCTDSLLGDSVCLHTSVMQCFTKQFSSSFLWWPVQLPSSHSRNDLCKKPNAMETPLKDTVAWKVPIQFSSVPTFSTIQRAQGSRSEDHLFSYACYPLSIKSPLSADQKVLQGTSWNISEQPLFPL